MKLNKKIELIDDCRDQGGGWLVTLNPGWRFEDYAEHVKGYDTKGEALKAYREAQSCDCDDCIRALIAIDYYDASTI